MATEKKTIAPVDSNPSAVKPAKKAAPKKAATAKKDTTKKGTVPKKAVIKKVASPKKIDSTLLSVSFQLRYKTEFGQNLYLLGDHALLGNGDVTKAIPMQYLNEESWVTTIPWNATKDEKVVYNYVLKNSDGATVIDWGTDKFFNPSATKSEELLLIDTWNHAGFYENTFYANAFQKVLLKETFTPIKLTSPKTITHTFKVKSPLLPKGYTLCMVGSVAEMGSWITDTPLLMGRVDGTEHYEVSLNCSSINFPIAYKYGIYDTINKLFIRLEEGNNRFLFDTVQKKKQTIIHDGYAHLPNNGWKGAGVAIPVFSLRSENSFGVGEFADLKGLADWAQSVGLKMIQVLPINDTTATNSWKDSYPYAAISAFALHPIYLNLSVLANGKHKAALKKLEAQRLLLNALPEVDYDAVIKAKTNFIQLVYKQDGASVLASTDFMDYFNQNKHWLVSYAVFCYLRDEYGTVDFSKWPAYKQYKEKDIAALAKEGSAAYNDIAFHYFVQYHLHLQLKSATEYAHSKGIIVKGDIAIGVYRFGADTWQQPALYHLDYQAGAPPDDFAVSGQNWGFPTYNWQHMQQDGFAWWKQRFEQMNHYFDAFRIDHILGFFRIWSIPLNAVEGIMGHFVPALPVHKEEFSELGIWFDYHRYTQPFITDTALWEIFGYDNELVKSMFLEKQFEGSYALKPAFATQRLVEQHFLTLEQDEHHHKIKQGLYDLISNVILFDANGNGQEFHFRIGIEKTTSFRNLEINTQQSLKELYVNYFYRRQDEFWKKEALQKLPALKRVTSMVVCGEDLGMVPSCVPDVMQQLGLLSLEIQRMPKDAKKEFFHPNDAPYLSVVTPSTHDMSTIRGWWEEDREKIQRFYNNELGQWGEAPFHCETWINKAVVVQHLFSPAMFAVFQLQDLLGMHEQVRRNNPADERINIPADPNHYWRYRMHFSLEELSKANLFNQELFDFIKSSGR